MDWKEKYLNKITQGDCLELMKELPDNCIDLILIDPPYFIPAVHYDTRKRFKRNFADLGILEGFFKTFFDRVDKVLKKDGLFYMFCNGQSYPIFFCYAYSMFKTVRPLIWDKKTSINGYYWRHQHELILFGVRPEKHKIPTGDGDILRYSAVKVDNRIHPAQKPLNLIKKLLLKTSKEGDIILDSFIGSGTTAVACKQLNRNFIGFDISKEYCKIARKRLEDVDKQKTLVEKEIKKLEGEAL
ncbi:site-specific DNA-methyltransferase [Candidatus Woesearchaeota archaeon]|nr:site-specific DNA-methyltransferase [Candidatus Woesearchaeota archaeon]